MLPELQPYSTGGKEKEKGGKKKEEKPASVINPKGSEMRLKKKKPTKICV